MSNIVRFDDFGDEIRVTEDGRFSVYDVIKFCGKKSQHEVWKRLCKEHSEVLTKCDNFKFPGKGQRETPVANRENVLYIIGLLPGAIGRAYREEAARVFIQYLDADVELTLNLVERTENPEDLKKIELRAKVKQSNKALNAVIHEHGGVRGQIVNGRSLNTYAQVANMNNRSVTGMTAQQIKKTSGAKNTRDALQTKDLAGLLFREDVEARAIAKNQAHGHHAIVGTVKSVLDDIEDLVEKWT